MKLVWCIRRTISSSIASTPHHASTTPSDVNRNAEDKETIPVAAAADTAATAVLAEREKRKPDSSSSGWFCWKLSGKKSTASRSDPEKQTSASRPMCMFSPVYGGLGAGLSLRELVRLSSPFHLTFCSPRLVFICSGVSTLISETRLDSDYTRFALVATAPFLVCVSLVRSIRLICAPLFRSERLVNHAVLRPPNHYERVLCVRLCLLLSLGSCCPSYFSS